jgi:hypothetical protein
MKVGTQRLKDECCGTNIENLESKYLSIMFEDFKGRIRDKRYQELSKPYRIVIWLMYMPFGYIKGLAWYFVERLRWEDVRVDDDDEDCGRISLGTCVGICVGIVQVDMRWYYTSDEVFSCDGSLISRSDDKGFFHKMFEFSEDKFVEIVDGKTGYG